MSNTHGTPDTLYETMARESDLLPQAIASTTWPTAPGSGLTLAAFATKAYIRKGNALYYVDQPAQAVTVPNVAGNHWLAVAVDTHSAMAGWTRIPGSHYLQQQSATQPAGMDGLLGFAQVVVSGGNVTTVTPLFTAPLAEAWRQWLALGTMSTQNANAVAITGGTATGLSTLTTTGNVGIANSAPSYPLDVTGNVRVTGVAMLAQMVSNGPSADAGDAYLKMFYPKGSHNAIVIRPTVSDTGGGQPVVFRNTGDGTVGSISTTASATAYNTSSDVRLKESVKTLLGALDVVRALHPVSFRWQADGSPGIGFLAHELMTVVPEAVTGLPDAVGINGEILPQQVDHSRLIPHLTGAIKELLAQVEALTTRVAELEAAML